MLPLGPDHWTFRVQGGGPSPLRPTANTLQIKQLKQALTKTTDSGQGSCAAWLQNPLGREAGQGCPWLLWVVGADRTSLREGALPETTGRILVRPPPAVGGNRIALDGPQ